MLGNLRSPFTDDVVVRISQDARVCEGHVVLDDAMKNARGTLTDCPFELLEPLVKLLNRSVVSLRI